MIESLGERDGRMKGKAYSGRASWGQLSHVRTRKGETRRIIAPSKTTERDSRGGQKKRRSARLERKEY